MKNFAYALVLLLSFMTQNANAKSDSPDVHQKRIVKDAPEEEYANVRFHGRLYYATRPSDFDARMTLEFKKDRTVTIDHASADGSEPTCMGNYKILQTKDWEAYLPNTWHEDIEIVMDVDCVQPIGSLGKKNKISLSPEPAGFTMRIETGEGANYLWTLQILNAKKL